MPVLTRDNLVAAIKREARIANTELDTLIGEVLDGVVEDTFYNQRCPELKAVTTSFTLVNATATTALPGSFQHIEQLDYSTDSGTTYRQLWPKSDNVVYKSVGIPRWYEIQGTNLYLFPSSLILSTHTLKLTYYAKPTFTSGSTSFPVLRLQEPVKKEVISRLFLYHKDKMLHDAMVESSDKSLDKARSAVPEARNPDSIDTRQPNFEVAPQYTKGAP